MQTTMGNYFEASTSENLDVNCIISQEEETSKYFRIQKSHSVINKKEVTFLFCSYTSFTSSFLCFVHYLFFYQLTQEGKQKHFIFNEKLLKTKSDENNNVPLQKMVSSDNIEFCIL